jgi:RNA 2',3'-cyclic 3'-phosphodiesterase
MRCFVAIELPAEVRKQLAELQGRLNAMDSFVRWIRPEQIHLTLKFLGEVPDRQVPEVCSAVVETAARLDPMPIEVAGTGYFPRGGPARVVWAGVVGPSSELIACQAACERVLAELGYPPEDRDFRPHLTIGRSREPNGAREVRGVLAAAGEFRCRPFIASELVIFQSVLGRAGPTYTALARAKLNSA